MRHDDKEDMEEIVNSFSKNTFNMLKESVSLICRTEERFEDFDVPTLERYPEILMKNYEFRLYGLCEYSNCVISQTILNQIGWMLQNACLNSSKIIQKPGEKTMMMSIINGFLRLKNE